MYETSDCCGNGCANCVLDIKSQKIKLNKHNVINNYTNFTLINKIKYTHLQDGMELHFKWSNEECMQEDFMLYIPAGHHLMLRIALENDKYLLRPYSPFWVDDLKLEFKILITLKPYGVMKDFFLNLLILSKVEFRGPIGNYYHEKKHGLKCFITQGVAIAPTMRLVETILNDEEDESRLIHFVCAKNFDNLFFRKELLEFGSYWNYKCHIFLSQQNCGETECLAHNCTLKCKTFQTMLRYKENVHLGRLNVNDMETICNGFKQLDKEFIIAGTQDFQNSILNIIKEKSLVNSLDDCHLL